MNVGIAKVTAGSVRQSRLSGEWNQVGLASTVPQRTGSVKSACSEQLQKLQKVRLQARA